MNFLEICQKVHNALGIQGSFNDVETNDTIKVIAQAVNDGWSSIQNYRKDWKFLMEEADLVVSSGTTTYTVDFILGSNSGNFGSWDTSNFICDDYKLKFIAYDKWRYDVSDDAVKAYEFSIRPNDNAVLTQNVTTGTTLELMYYRAPQDLSNNSDTPILPAAYHNLIVYAGILNASVFFSTPELYQHVSQLFDKLLGSLMRDQIPSRNIRRRAFA